MKRPLGVFETAQVLTGLFSPFNLVLVLRLNNGPAVAALRECLRSLCLRHPLLRASIPHVGGRYVFNVNDRVEIPIEQMRRGSDDAWRRVAERELNTGFELETAPLMRVTYLAAATDGGPCELLITAHHAIIDGVAAARLLHDLLSMCAELDAGRDIAESTAAGLKAPAEALFPRQFTGLSGAAHQTAFFGRQLLNEARCRIQNRGLDQPAIHTAGSCRIRPFRLSAEHTRALVNACKSRRLTLNSLLCAAQLRAAQRHGFRGAPVTLRHFVFADLRPYLKPPVPPGQLGNYAAMLQLTTRLEDARKLWPLARSLTEQVHQASKKGDKYSSLRMSKFLMKTILRAKKPRMGHAALSFSGTVPMSSTYGRFGITDLHALVSNLVLGPAYTANARIFMRRLCWDMVYLDSDMDRESSVRLQEMIEQSLIEAAET